jgi:nicotinate-nucleotide pyrophosphorylase (carboxylating)
VDLDRRLVERLVRAALDEDLGEAGDITTACSVPSGRRGEGRIIAKESGVLAGLPLAAACFRMLDGGVAVEELRADGDALAAGDIVLRVRGSAPALLAGERTALNFLQRLSGIATATRAFVAAVAGTGARVLDTRKTTPGLRALEKYAVRIGGGENHRFGLYDQVLLKENHFALALPATCEEVVQHCVARSDRPVIAEARTVGEALMAVRGGARVVMLDNFPPGAELRSAVAAVRAAAAGLGVDVEIEVSGGVDLERVRTIAECGADRISVGRLTHSARALDLSMLIEFTPVGPAGR